MSCGVGRRCGSDPMLLCLWYMLAAVAPIGPAWEYPCASGLAPKRKKRGQGEGSIHHVPNDVAQWKRIWLASMWTQVQSLASLSGLKIQHCCGCGCGIGQQLQLWFDPSPGNLHMLQVSGPKKTKTKTKTKKQKHKHRRLNLEFRDNCLITRIFRGMIHSFLSVCSFVFELIRFSLTLSGPWILISISLAPQNP